MKKILIIMALLVFAGISRADIVQLDLFSIGCPTEFDYYSPPYWWQSDFDLGVTFSQIDHVSIDWAGEITGGMVISYSDPCNPHPANVSVYAGLIYNSFLRSTDVWGGGLTHPNPEPFSVISQIGASGTAAWSELLDGTGRVSVSYDEAIMMNGLYIEHGSISLNKANLIIDGTVVPEPGTLLLLAFGVTNLKIRRFIKSN